MSDENDEVLEVIPLSATYALILARSRIGHAPALAIKLRHESPETGAVSYRGGFVVFHHKLPDVIAALSRIQELL